MVVVIGLMILITKNWVIVGICGACFASNVATALGIAGMS